MIHQVCPNPELLHQLYTGPLGAYVDTFAQQMLGQGYASSTAKYAMRVLAAFSTWLQRQDLTATDLNEQQVEDFLQDHPWRSRPRRSDRSVLGQLIAQLRDHGVIPLPVVEAHNCACERVTCDFQHYLLQQRCLVPVTVSSYLDVVRRFLHDRFGSHPLRLEALSTQDITDVMLRQHRQYSLTYAKLSATALRSFFRFLLQAGAIPTDLAKAVPTVPNWRLSGLPKFMKAEDVACLLHSCDRQTAKGQRDYAILLLLARLGLRAGEVVALTLDDLDWEAGELLVRGKGARQARLPLPHEVGEALVTYICEGRPPSTTRQVFLRTRAPHRGFANSQGISTIVSRALDRAGLEPALKGAHLLRHSLATQLLQNGASLVEIGELLRHQHIETTRIYAKVDQPALRALALPWPGGEV